MILNFVGSLWFWIILLVVVIILTASALKLVTAEEETRLRAIELSDIDNMDGVTFESYVAKLLINEGFGGVTLTKASGDLGVDITASKGGNRYSIQVKRRSSTVPRNAVSDAVAGKEYYSCNAAMVITNNYLSKKSNEFARSIGCIVVDRDELVQWILRYQSQAMKN